MLPRNTAIAMERNDPLASTSSSEKPPAAATSVEVQRAGDEAVSPERGREQHAADQDEPARAEAIGERAQHRARPPAHQGEDRERAREDRPAPAELTEEGDEEDAVGVPDPVGQGEGDDGDGEGAVRREAGRGHGIGAHGHPVTFGTLDVLCIRSCTGGQRLSPFASHCRLVSASDTSHSFREAASSRAGFGNPGADAPPVAKTATSPSGATVLCRVAS